MPRNRGPTADKRNLVRDGDANVGRNFQSSLRPHYNDDNVGQQEQTHQTQQLKSFNANTPLKQNLVTAQDFSTRESSKPLGDDYADIKKMISEATSGSGSGSTAGTGLTLNAGALDVNTSLSHVTSLGTLTGLTVSGASTFSGTVSVPTPTASGHAASKSYVDGAAVTAGSGLSQTGSVISLAPITSVGTLTGLTVGGNATLTGKLSVGKCLITPLEYNTPVDADTVTAVANSPGLLLNPATALPSLTIVLPSAPVDGQHFSVTSSHSVTSLTLTATFAVTAPTSLSAGVALHWIYSADAASWFNL